MDTDVYSWRVPRELKSDLERQARIRKTCMGTIAGCNPRRTETARQTIRERLKRRNAR
jgi:hypothetical protein